MSSNVHETGPPKELRSRISIHGTLTGPLGRLVIVVLMKKLEDLPRHEKIAFPVAESQAHEEATYMLP